MPDPANPQSLNRYSYVLNNPMRYTDPTGHWGVVSSLLSRFAPVIATPSRPSPTATPIPVPLAPCPGGGDWCHELVSCGAITLFCSGIELAAEQVLGPSRSFCIATYPLCGDYVGRPALWQRALAGADVGLTIAAIAGPKVKLPRLPGLTNRAIGLAAEERIAAELAGSTTQVGRGVALETSLGTRVVDVLADGLAIESKVGRTALTTDIQRQIAKDVALMNDPQSRVDSVLWIFSRSPVTGLAGPTRGVQDALSAAGIPWVVLP